MKYILLLSFALNAASAFCQRISTPHLLEAGLMAGFTNYAGDATENLPELSETKAGCGIFARYHCASWFAVKAQLYTGNISGTDAHARDSELRARSLRFKSNIFEIALVGEWNVWNIKPEQRNGIRNIRVVPFLYAGIGGVLMHPRAEYFGPPGEFDEHVRFALPERGLSEKAIVIPVGAGLRAQITDRITVGAEGGMRPVFSDNLDGISRNGNPGRNDWYYTAVGTVSFAVSR